MQFFLFVSIVLQTALNDAAAFTSIPDILNGIGELEVTGGNSIVFVGDFPELKLCEGSANGPAGHTPGGDAACCIKLLHDVTNSVAPVTNSVAPVTAPALHGGNCKATNGRRKLSECPSDTFEVAHACQHFGFWCHEDGSVVSGCVNCDLCDSPDTCPGCHPERRSLTAPMHMTFTGYRNIGEGHCVDFNHRRPPHCYGVIGEQVCRELCTANSACKAYEYGQDWSGILCQLIYDISPQWCPRAMSPGSGGNPSATEIIQTAINTGGSCYKKTQEAVEGKMKIKVDGPNSLVLVGSFPKLKLCEGAGNHGNGHTRGGDIVCCVVLATKPKLQGDSCTGTSGRRNLNGFCPDGSFDVKRACRESAEWCHQTEGALNTCLGCNNCVDPKTCPECTRKELKI